MEGSIIEALTDTGIAGGVLVALWIVLKHEEMRHERIAGLVEKLIERVGKE